MRSFFLLAIALCFVASVSAQATVYTWNYPTADCSGAYTSNTTYTTYNLGQAYNVTSSPAYYYGLEQAVFADVSGNFFITVSYTDQTASTIYGISQSFGSSWFGGQYLNQCTATITGSKMTTVVSPTAGPVAPTAGSGWAQATAAYNSTTNPYTQITTCPQASGSGVTILSSWYAPNVCYATGSLPYGQESTAAYITGNGLFVGGAKFGSSNCAANTLLSAGLQPVGVCNRGSVLSASGVSSVFPSSLPNQGKVTYSSTSTDCTNSDSLATVSVIAGTAAAPVCADRTTFYCSTNTTSGVTQATIQQWSDTACTVPNAGSPAQTYTAAGTSQGNTLATALNLNAFCVTQGTQRYAYSCQFFTGSASSVSFSVFALLVAAVASLIASKSL